MKLFPIRNDPVGLHSLFLFFSFSFSLLSVPLARFFTDTLFLSNPVGIGASSWFSVSVCVIATNRDDDWTCCRHRLRKQIKRDAGVSVAPQPISRNSSRISEKRPTQSTNRSQLSPTTIHWRQFFLTPRRIARRFYPLPFPRPSARLLLFLLSLQHLCQREH